MDEDAHDQDYLASVKYWHRMDIIWGHIAGMKHEDDSFKFNLLSQIVQVILVIPHSNAGEERVFSLIRKNKTAFRGSLGLNGTLVNYNIKTGHTL